jgi:hypothetical protein
MLMFFKSKHCLQDVFEVNGLKNVVNVPTCYKGKDPTCIDLVVTNSHSALKMLPAITMDLVIFTTLFASQQNSMFLPLKAINYL